MAMFRAPKDLYHRPPKVKQCNTEEVAGIHTCDICSQGWDSDTEVDIHRTTSHKNYLLQILKNKKNYPCRVCIKPHKSKEELIRHVKSWHLLSSEDAVRVEREIFICDVCSVVFFNKRMLEVHIHIFHSTCDKLLTPIECPKCSKQYRFKNLWSHFQRHCLMSVACCKICLTKCPDRHAVFKHIKGHSKYFFCDICQYESKIESYFKEHLAARHGRARTRAVDASYRPYFMPPVGDNRSRFVSDTPVKGLRLSYFDNVELRICVLCREICLGEQGMKDHILNAHMACETQQLSHVCCCGETFSTKVLLKHHIFKSGAGHKDDGTLNPDEDVVVYAVVLMDDEECTNEDHIMCEET